MVKRLSREHKEHLSHSIQKWWRINKRNRRWMAERSRRISKALTGKKMPWVSQFMKGRTPPNKGKSIYPVRQCKRCGKGFRSDSRKLYCSRDCYVADLRENWRKLHPNHPYASSFSKRTLIREIGRCERCGCRDLRILMAHHKDGNRKNNVRENLLVVCPNDHAVEHLNRNGQLDYRGWHRMVTESDMSA